MNVAGEALYPGASELAYSVPSGHNVMCGQTLPTYSMPLFITLAATSPDPHPQPVLS